MFNVETKSQLARLMANENIKVEHRNVHTASFHLEQRILTCPIWKDMSGYMYDLLMGHEIGHATETPIEGWHDAVVTDPRKNFKHFLNVVEDARIEKKIKRRYPGLRQSFVKAYDELVERDFFGIKKRDIQTAFLIDRINLHFKLGSLILVRFTPEEQKFVDMVSACETWEDVVDASEAIYAYSKKEQQKSSAKKNEKGEKSENEDYEQSEDDLVESDEDSEDEDSEDEDEDSDDEDSEEIVNGNDAMGANSDDEESDDEDSDAEGSDVAPDCLTDKQFRQNESSLVDTNASRYIYATIPTVNLEKIIDNDANAELTNHFKNSTLAPQLGMPNGNQLVAEFKAINDRYISLLAKEFEMKKSAEAFSKKRISETGDIDVSKIYRYKLDDTIFRKMMYVPKGKSHGLVMLLDKSGSMNDSMSGAIEQILVLAMFCRKVNIPFDVYGFTNNIKSENYNCQFSNNPGDLSMRKVSLRHMISSKMKAAEFTEALKNLLTMKYLYQKVSYPEGYLPSGERLGNTPLNEALVAIKPVIENFKLKNNLDMVNLVIVHDGDADPHHFINGHGIFYPASHKVFIKDPKSKIQIKIEESDRGLTVGLMNYITKTTGAKVMGFFIAGKTRYVRAAFKNYYTDENGKSFTSRDNFLGSYLGDESGISDLLKQLRKQKFVQSYTSGYNKLFIIPGDADLNFEDERLKIDGKITANKLASAFMKVNKNRQTSRVMIGRFIEAIAKH